MKRRQMLGLTMLSIAVMLGLAWWGFGTVTEQRRLSALAEAGVPPILEQHRELARQLRETPEVEPAPPEAGECPDELARARAYAVLLEDAGAFFQREPWVSYDRLKLALHVSKLARDGAPERVLEPMKQALGELALACDGSPERILEMEQQISVLEKRVLEEGAPFASRLLALLPCGGPMVVVDMKGATKPGFMTGVLEDALNGSPELLRLHGLAASRRGESAQAVSTVTSMLYGAALVARIPMASSIHASATWVYSAQELLESSTTWDSLTYEQCDELLAAVAEARSAYNLDAAMAMAMNGWLGFNQAWRATSLSGFVKGAGVVQGVRCYLWAGPLCAPLYDQDEERLIRLYGDVAATVQLPHAERRARVEALLSEAEALPVIYNRTRQVTRHIRNEFNTSEYQSLNLALVEAGLLIERYERLFGRFPASLDELEEVTQTSLAAETIQPQAIIYAPWDTWFALFLRSPPRDDETQGYLSPWRDEQMDAEQREQAFSMLPVNVDP